MNRRRSLRSYVVEILFTYGARRRHLLLPGQRRASLGRSVARRPVADDL